MIQRPRGEAATVVTLFFYGTLKRGHANHHRYCRGALRAEEATLRGELYDLPFGFPALVVPQEDVYATGSADPIHDASEQQRLNDTGVHRSDGPRVHGELFTFDDPETRLPALDRLEGFDPDGGPSLYRRVLVPVETTERAHVAAWVYAIEKPSGVYLPGGRWPS
ncbi:MAG: gamma-glutamylcyclotransferase [Rubrobacteraceae bacterium]|nr:gamma-glutamylcyclotransferase [Rubrobacteraceae bacterium]MDQ5811745.1 gamma-glutamylcyclotransferase [Actinomycetota bacterium]